MTRLDWLKNKIKENANDYKTVQECFYEEYCKVFNTSCSYKSYKDSVRNAFSSLQVDTKEGEDEVEYNADKLNTLERNAQKRNDLLSYYRRLSRNDYRTFNEIDSILQEVYKKLDEVKFDIPTIKEVKPVKDGKSALLCLSDLHLGTLINDSDINLCYDYEVISKRLKKYVATAIQTMKDNHVNTVYICNLGDIVSSNRRNDEKLGTVSATTNSCMIAVTLLEQIIAEVANNFNKVVVTGIIGNESRLNDDIEFHAFNLMNNWDWLTLTMLKHILNGKIKNVIFDVPQDPMKHLIKIPTKVGDFNVLIAHGNMIKGLKDNAERVYTTDFVENGTKINLVPVGHFHHLSVHSNGKLVTCGTTMRNNVYAKQSGFGIGHAYQNVFIINNDTSYWNMPINLDDISDIKEGYQFDNDLANCAYNQSTGVQKVNIHIQYN